MDCGGGNGYLVYNGLYVANYEPHYVYAIHAYAK